MPVPKSENPHDNLQTLKFFKKNMPTVKDFSVEEKLTALVKLQKVDSKLDEIGILKGELPMEVSDLEMKFKVCMHAKLGLKKKLMVSLIS